MANNYQVPAKGLHRNREHYILDAFNMVDNQSGPGMKGFTSLLPEC